MDTVPDAIANLRVITRRDLSIQSNIQSVNMDSILCRSYHLILCLLAQKSNAGCQIQLQYVELSITFLQTMYSTEIFR